MFHLTRSSFWRGHLFYAFLPFLCLNVPVISFFSLTFRCFLCFCGNSRFVVISGQSFVLISCFSPLLTLLASIQNDSLTVIASKKPTKLFPTSLGSCLVGLCVPYSVLLLLDCDIFLITASRIVRVCHCNPPLIQKFPDISCRGFPFFETKVFCYFLCASWNITETNDSLKYQPFLVNHLGGDLGSDLGRKKDDRNNSITLSLRISGGGCWAFLE